MWLWTARPGRSSWREKASDSSADLPQLPSGEGTSLQGLPASPSYSPRFLSFWEGRRRREE